MSSTFWKETLLLLLSSLFQRSKKDKHFDQVNAACNAEEQHYLASPHPADCTFKYLSSDVEKKKNEAQSHNLWNLFPEFCSLAKLTKQITY